MRSLLLLALPAVAYAVSCPFNTSTAACPIAGQPCTQAVLCAKGLYCKALSVGEDGKSFSGVCDVEPSLSAVYGKACTLGNDIPECVFNNPLALSPRSKPSALQCIRAFDTDTAGTCRIGPNKHGDACNQDGECASGRCLRELRICKGIDEGETCEPSFPDPCEPNHYCLPKREGVETTGSCAKVISAGKACTYSEACERGYYCAGPTLATRRCVAPFTVEDGFNTTVGPYMCKSANAVLAVSQQSSVNSIYTCVSANTTESLVGTECNPAAPPPPGFECVCSGRGSVYRLRTVNGLGLASRSAVWPELFKCLEKSTSIMNEVCEFDSVDLESVRYGSCAFYACYPQYLRLVNVTGGRHFVAPLDQFETFAKCELDAAKDYYENVMSTECVSLPNLENWKCATDAGPVSLSVASTSAVVIIVMLAFIFAYIGHTYKFRFFNRQTLPFVKN